MLFEVKTATLEELRADPDCLERWISAGEEVRIVKIGTPFANVVPLQFEDSKRRASSVGRKLPDFEARARRIRELNGGRSLDADIENLRDRDDRNFAES